MNNRIPFVDYARVVACLLVMVVHASENFYGADSSGLAGNMSMLANESNRFWVAFWDGGVARTCVPIFIIISSFLLVPLKPGQTMTTFYRRRFLRILPPMIFFMLVYTFLPLAWGGMTWEQSMHDLRMLPFNFPSMAGHLWFMYPLISLYIIMPIISPWLERSSARDERIFLGFFALSTFIPWIHMFIAKEIWGECFWNGFHALWYCSGYLGYLVLAHYIRFHINWSVGKRLRVGGICFLVGAVFTWWSFYMKGVPGVLIETPDLEWGWTFCTPNIALATFGVFLLFSAIKNQANKAVTEIARLSFGMYLMHMLFLAPIANMVIGDDNTHPLLPVGLAIPVIAISTFICCLITTKILSKLPGSKYFVGA